jgi:hypothetical protein
MEILKSGSEVMVGDIKMTVVSVNITGDQIGYNMVWYDGNTRNCAFINNFEITSFNTEDLRTIGFKS